MIFRIVPMVLVCVSCIVSQVQPIDSIINMILSTPTTRIAANNQTARSVGTSLTMNNASWYAESNKDSARLGFSASGAGDINGDEYPDVVVGAPYYSNVEKNEGMVFVYMGGPNGLSTAAVMQLGIHCKGALFGYSVAGAGDVNGDGYADVVIGAPQYTNGETGEGAIFLFLGSSFGLTNTPQWHYESNQAGAMLGYSVDGGEDINNDGFSDIITGVYYYTQKYTKEGAAFIFCGSQSGLSATPSWGAYGGKTNAYYGASVALCRDVNKDGWNEIIVGAPGYTNPELNEGAVFTYSGNSPYPSITGNWIKEGNSAGMQLGRSVACAGDVNRDGYGDVIIGTHYYKNGEPYEGCAMLFLGSSTGLSPTPAWQFEPNFQAAYFGFSVAGAGDINGDGYSDVIVGSPMYQHTKTGEGGAFVFFGCDTGLSGIAGWVTTGEQERATYGWCVTGAGDVNGDGFSDVLVGAMQYDNGHIDEGITFLFNGNTSGLSSKSIPLMEPANEIGNIGTTITCKWHAYAQSETYTLQIATVSNFSTIVYEASDIQDTSFVLQGLSMNTKYYWRVYAKAKGIVLAWSEIWCFSTKLSPPLLDRPVNESINLTLNFTLYWKQGPAGVLYHLQISKTPDFTDGPWYSNPATPYYFEKVSTFSHNTQYFWRVRAYSPYDSTGWSEVWNFTTLLSTPLPVSPLNNSINVPCSPTLRWQPAGGASTYQIQVSTNNQFSSLIHENLSLTDTACAPANLSPSTVYYWRVKAKNGLHESQWSAVQGFTTNLATPILNTPDNAAVHLPCPVTLSWTKSASGSYRIQIGKEPMFTPVIVDENVGSTGEYLFQSAVPGATYFWRVMLVQGAMVSDWSETRFFSTTPQPPVPRAPEDKATVVPLIPAFTWNSVPGAYSYGIQVSASPLFDDMVMQSFGIRDTVMASSRQLESLSRYFWRVRTQTPVDVSEWSGAFEFTTLLSAPHCMTPEYDAINAALVPHLIWNPVHGAASFRIQIAEDSLFTAIVADSTGIAAAAYNGITLKPDMRYFWRVQAQAPEETSQWSAYSCFTTLLETPVPVIPMDNAVNVSIVPQLYWKPVPNAQQYQVQIASDSLFTQIVQDSSGIADTLFTVKTLGFQTRFFWHVKASNGGKTGDWSPVQSFTTLLQPVPLLSPANQTGRVSVPVTLSWLTTGPGTAYRVQLSTRNDFLVPMLDSIAGMDVSSCTVPNLAAGATYYWRVMAMQGSLSSLWSQPWSFSTGPAAPVLLTPQNGMERVPLRPVFTWAAVPKALYYRLAVSTSPDFETVFLQVSKTKKTTYTSSKTCAPFSRYYWRVKAYFAADSSGWSPVSSFTTVGVAPNRPVYLRPVNGASKLSTTPTFRWNKARYAREYGIQIAENPSFTTVVYANTSIQDTSFTLSKPLAYGSRYYWRVAAKNEVGGSPWSSVKTLYTEPQPLTAPVLSAPGDGVEIIGPNPVLEWRKVAGAKTYQVQIATDDRFTTCTVNRRSIASGRVTISGLQYNQVYFWRVYPQNGSTKSQWSQVWRFKIIKKKK